MTGREPNDYFGSPLFKPAVRIEGLLRRRSVAPAYAADVQQEFASLAPHLPAPCRAVLDIGCGVAGVDVPLFASRSSEITDLYLLDRTTTAPRIFYGFAADGAFYNSLAVARRLLEDNGVPPGVIHLLEATPDGQIPIGRQLDLVISLISWGFHYPVATYLERVHALLRPAGRLILDVRKGLQGERELAKRFARVETVFDRGKVARLVATK
jgi:SAM-dependent methyltransferase